jgi:hypothetical protein
LHRTANLAALFAGLEFTQETDAYTNHPGKLLLGYTLLFALLADQHAEDFRIFDLSMITPIGMILSARCKGKTKKTIGMILNVTQVKASK